MAGIGFELRRLLNRDDYTGLLGAYTYAGTVTAGPWILSIMTILALVIIGRVYNIDQDMLYGFEVIVVYLIAGSLIVSSIFQHSYTRYIADEVYLKRKYQIIPTLNSVYVAMMFIGGVIGTIAVQYFIPEQSLNLKIITVSLFILLCMIWVTTSVLSGLLAYKTIFSAFLLNFVIAVSVGLYAQEYEMSGLLFGFLCGQFFLFMVMIYVTYKEYPARELINYDYFTSGKTKRALLFTSIFYNMAIWADKFIFWLSPETGEVVFGNLYASPVYDIPIFLSYLAVIPGMISFMLKMETDYADSYFTMYERVTGKNTLDQVKNSYYDLLKAGRSAIYSVIRSEAYMILIGITAGTFIFHFLSIPLAYIPLFLICLLAAGLNVMFWGVLDIIFYLDKIYHGLFLTFFFLVSNIILTIISIKMGIFFYGYGLVTSLLLTNLLAFIFVNREMRQLPYETYMLQ